MMHFDPVLADQAISQLVDGFDRYWLEDAIRRKSLGSPLASQEHELGQWLAVGGEPQIASVLELAEYMRWASRRCGYGALIIRLKGQFAASLLQVAMAYRFDRAGAEDVELEPPVEGGKFGDIEFRLGSQRYVVECFKPLVVSDAREFDWLMSKTLKLLSDSKRLLSVGIQLRKPLEPGMRKRILQTLTREIRAFPEGSASSGFLADTPEASISITKTKETFPPAKPAFACHSSFPAVGQPAVFGCIGQMPKAHLDPRLLDRGATVRGANIAIWRDPSTQRDHSLEKPLGSELGKLTKQLKKKLSQTRRSDGSRRVLVVETWLRAQLPRAEYADLTSLKEAVIDRREGVAGILFVQRRFGSRSKRFVYDLTSVLASDEIELRSLLSTAASQEASSTVPAVVTNAG